MLAAQWDYCCSKLVQNLTFDLALGAIWTARENLSLFFVIMSKFPHKQYLPPYSVVSLKSDSVNIEDILCLWTCKMFHTFNCCYYLAKQPWPNPLSGLKNCRHWELPKRYLSSEGNAKRDISIHFEQWGCRWNKKVLQRKVFSFKWMKKKSIPLLYSYSVPQGTREREERAKEVTTQHSEIIRLKVDLTWCISLCDLIPGCLHLSLGRRVSPGVNLLFAPK